MELLELWHHSKSKIDDRWDENPFFVYRRDNDKTRVDFVQNNIRQIKRSVSARKRANAASRNQDAHHSMDDLQQLEDSKILTMSELKLDLIKVNGQD